MDFLVGIPSMGISIIPEAQVSTTFRNKKFKISYQT